LNPNNMSSIFSTGLGGGGGGGTIKQTVAAVGSRTFKNFGGNWY